MKPANRRLKRGRLMGLALVPLCLCGPSGAAATDGDALAAARREVLANPLDREAVARLGQLRARQRQRRIEALDGLVHGLQAYIEGRRRDAALHLHKARQSPAIRAWADRRLLRSIDELIQACGGAAATRPTTRVCGLCGGTGRSDCVRCGGAGWRTCPECKGKGHVIRHGDELVCPTCRGEKLVACKVCEQTGTVTCVRCGLAKGQEPGPYEKSEMTKIIGIARYLRSGGLDLYTSEALEPAPKAPASQRSP